MSIRYREMSRDIRSVDRSTHYAEGSIAYKRAVLPNDDIYIEEKRKSTYPVYDSGYMENEDLDDYYAERSIGDTGREEVYQFPELSDITRHDSRNAYNPDQIYSEESTVKNDISAGRNEYRTSSYEDYLFYSDDFFNEDYNFNNREDYPDHTDSDGFKNVSDIRYASKDEARKVSDIRRISNPEIREKEKLTYIRGLKPRKKKDKDINHSPERKNATNVQAVEKPDIKMMYPDEINTEILKANIFRRETGILTLGSAQKTKPAERKNTKIWTAAKTAPKTVKKANTGRNSIKYGKTISKKAEPVKKRMKFIKGTAQVITKGFNQGKQLENYNNRDYSYRAEVHKNNNPVKIITQIISAIIVKLTPIWILLLGALILFITIFMDDSSFYEDTRIITASFPAAVEAWRIDVRSRLQYYTDNGKYGELDIMQYENAILATIWQESSGNANVKDYRGNRTGDIMQSKESGYWTSYLPQDWGSLSNTSKSIDAGIRHYLDISKQWEYPSASDFTGLQMVAQGYNYGYGFLPWAKRNGITQWSLSISRQYAYRMSSSGRYGHAEYGSEWLDKYSNSTGTGGSWVWPMPYGRSISSGFGARWGTTHRGIDIPCPVGSNVIASNNGTVVHVGWYGTAGNAVIVDCGDGLKNYYYHLSAFKVNVGDVVTAGQIIALSGNTGNSTGPHLHFGVSINGQYVDPTNYLN
ncbi:MAG: M23 family metallopeptidase [Eubacterium sp.]|nr:M23 family metallopeptidase [Eubacterium sp.]